MDHLIDWHHVLSLLSYHYATHAGHYFKIDGVAPRPELLADHVPHMVQKPAPHTKAGTAFFDDATGTEWEALQLFNRCTGQVVQLPRTAKIDADPNISQSRHNGHRTIDDGTYKKWCEYYNIERETDAQKLEARAG